MRTNPTLASPAVANLIETIIDATHTIPTRPNWDEAFLTFAHALAPRSTCTRRRVVAIAVDKRHRVIGVGYNGTPEGFPHCGDGGCPRGQLTHHDLPPDSDYNTPGTNAWCPAAHAEDNAILDAGRHAHGCTLYVTHRPCPACMKRITAAGVARAVWYEPSTRTIHDVVPHEALLDMTGLPLPLVESDEPDPTSYAVPAGAYVQEVLDERNLTAADLAQACDLTDKQARDFIAGRIALGPHHLQRIAAFSGIKQQSLERFQALFRADQRRLLSNH